jgi:tRNA 5-methylaminomethyl-2-thiouridine biosynthesis bifunctional protein
LGGRVGFRAVPPDRLPLVGALPQEEAAGDLRDARLGAVPRWQGLYCLTGLGSRGMAWGMLAAELLASQLNGEPLPLETELVGAVDPARFLLRRHRRGKRNVDNVLD